MSGALITALISIIGGINILEIIGFFVFYKANKKSKDLDNDGKGIENKGKETENLDRMVDILNDVITMIKNNYKESEEDSKERKEENTKLYAENLELLKENNELKIKLASAELFKCEVRGCTNRQPPTGI